VKRMRSLLWFLIATILVFSLVDIGLTFENEPEGFRGMKWGDCPTPDMEIFPAGEDLPILYTRPGDKLALGDATFIRIVYAFHRVSYNRREFFSVSLHFAGKENLDLIKTICKQRFGEPYKERPSRIVWMSLKSIDYPAVSLVFSIVDQEGLLMLADPVRLSKYQEQREKETAKEAEKDW